MDKTLKFSLVISFFTHTLLLFSIPKVNFLEQLQKPQKIEVTYYKSQEESLNKKEDVLSKENIALKDGSLKALPPFIFKKEKIMPNFIKEDLLADKTKKIALIKDDAIKKKVTLPLMESANIKNPVYRNYFQSIRGRIKHYAYKNYTHLEEGSVYLTFIIAADGQLKESKIIDEKSTASPFLKDIALRSLKESSPYPSFPKDLDYPQLSFNVIISFELE